MKDTGGYGQFCPVAMASEILCTRWTTLVVRELLCGTTHFNDLRRGVPRMSPALLSKRLKDLERAGIVEARPNARGVVEYHLSEAGEDLRPVIMGLGFWGQRWVESELSLQKLDPSLLMWDMRRHLRPEPLPPRRCTIQFVYPDRAPEERAWWLVVDGGEVDLCGVDPGYEVDLLVRTSLRTMTAIWMGLATIRRETDAGRLELSGDPRLVRSMERWLGASPFAAEPRRAASPHPSSAVPGRP
ncbi:winged helix-turn-helix transcriptional regulator [Chthonobacter rhizosphaerae]|uniref:winged helix-turn-helix transcriptional regulator n=1 Tax=Chthonobacter rhizosphaerae TaxID=2735553 RepID=UPI0015EE9C49|nr:helix-turn-helix domain-containing protein [Chthonobacter rhizosphaerae]